MFEKISDSNIEPSLPVELNDDEWEQIFQKLAKFISDPLVDVEFTEQEIKFASQYSGFPNKSIEILVNAIFNNKYKTETDRQLALKLGKQIFKTFFVDLQKTIVVNLFLIVNLRVQQVLI